MENRRKIEKYGFKEEATVSKGFEMLMKIALLQVLNFVRFSQTVPFLWILLSAIIFLCFAFAPEPTGMTLLLVVRVLLLDQPDSALQGSVAESTVSMLLGRLFLFFSVLVYIVGTVLNRFQINFLRGFKRKITALAVFCLAVFFLLNICYSLARTPFNGPLAQWQVMFVMLSIALFLTGAWAILVGEVAGRTTKLLLTPQKDQ